MKQDAAPRVQDRPPFRVAEVILRWEVILVLLLAAIFALNAAVSPYFLDLYNLADASYNFSEKALIALPMAFLILVRDIDLSVAATVALSALGVGLAAAAGLGAPALIAAGIGVGLVCGMANGALVVLTGVPAIVITIGTMSLFRGIAQVALGDQALTQFPAGFLALGQSYAVEMPPAPLSFLLFLGFALAYGLVLHGTAAGRRLYAIGANPVAARFSGLRVGRIRFVLFALSGAMAGLASVLLVARIGVVRPNIALGWELDVITMVILGGVSIAGGLGSVPGVVLAVLVLGFTTFGLALLNVPGIVINVLIGLLLISAIAAPALVRRAFGREP
ncbi:MAG TPA: ABC transporter permease [Paracoccaceae bacterium]|nr:ABC transporter permease [Paracoccaceae bacterium]